MPTDTLPRMVPLRVWSSTSGIRPEAALLGIAERSAFATTDGGVRVVSFLAGTSCYVTRPAFPGSVYEWAYDPEDTPGLIEAPSPYVQAIRWIKETTGFSDERVARLIGVSRQTLANWERGTLIRDAHRQRLLVVREVLERAARLRRTPAELAVWLDTPRGADGRTPAEALEAGEFDRARYLAVASPSPNLVRPPSWVRRPGPPAFRVGAEHRQEPVPTEDPELAAWMLRDDTDLGEK